VFALLALTNRKAPPSSLLSGLLITTLAAALADVATDALVVDWVA